MRALKGSGFDAALLQEAPLCAGGWERRHYDRGATTVKLSDRVEAIGWKSIPPGRRPEPGEFTVSAPGTVAAAQIVTAGGTSFIAISLYARWEMPHPQAPTRWRIGYADAMAHRAISDLSAFIGDKDPATHRIAVAGDFNLIHGATERNALALPARDRSVFARFEALGLEFMGPQFPNGRKADRPLAGLAADTGNVPTCHSTRQAPRTAQNQLDYVFASRGFHGNPRVCALNEPDAWGPSDRCRIAIDVDASDLE